MSGMLISLIIWSAAFLVAALGAWYAPLVRLKPSTRPEISAPPSILCPCGGEWDRWSSVEIECRPGYGGTVETRIQTRYCPACGLADRRVVQ